MVSGGRIELVRRVLSRVKVESYTWSSFVGFSLYVCCEELSHTMYEYHAPLQSILQITKWLDYSVIALR